MPGSLWYPFRQGDRSEYLALYILSSLGVAIPVPRPEDIGADFYCSLAELDGERLTFRAPFIVQTKSYLETRISYGGMGRKRRWKKEEVDWLFSQEVPLLIGIVNKNKSELELFSTSNMWAARYEGGICGQVDLFPNRVDNKGLVPKPIPKSPKRRWPKGIGDGKVWEIPLGPPIVRISAVDAESQARFSKLRGVLSNALDVDQTNITYRRLSTHSSRWLRRYTTNRRASALGVFHAWNKKQGTNTNEQIRAILPIAAALARNYKAQGQTENIRRLKGLFALAPQKEIAADLKSYVPELFE